MWGNIDRRPTTGLGYDRCACPHSHFAVLYHVPDGCVIAEVNGPAVIQFGPFAEDVAPRELPATLLDEMPLVILSAQHNPPSSTTTRY